MLSLRRSVLRTPRGARITSNHERPAGDPVLVHALLAGPGRMSAELVEQTIAAHGGLALWEGADEVSVQLSSGGLAFASKLQGHAVRDVRAHVSTEGQRVSLSPYPRPGQVGILEPGGTVRIETDGGALVDIRRDARQAFADLRHKLWWDKLDILYFATYAIWTYLSTPFVFAREDYRLRELDPWQEGRERWRRLAVRFPDHVHTHSREQVFYIDSTGLIRRHDYVAEPIGALASAAHYCLDHRSFDGLVVPTRRRVYPRRADNRRRSGPLLVWIAVPDASYGNRGAHGSSST
jgi:hypothetical protein